MPLRLAFPPRRFALAALAAGVVGAHLWLGQSITPSPDQPGTLALAPPVQVRSVTPAAVPVTALTLPVPAVPARPAPPARRAEAVAARPAPEAADPTHIPPEAAPIAPAPVLVAAALPAQAVATEPTPVLAPAQEQVPVYRTEVPPPITLQYQMRRGLLSGTGELSWRRQGNSYEARLQGRVAGFSILTWVSRGGFDRAGLAPTRFTDERRGKGEQAANFQRSAGKISYSGPPTEYPLLDGTQDRLSWMIQIAAIANADPQLLAPGGRIAIFVTGARGDADVWTFLVQGGEVVRAGDAQMNTVRLLREPRKPYDTRVEVWLDPAQHHLPVRARLGADRDMLELLLQSTQAPS